VTVTRLVLCRHGEPDGSVRGRICGSLDVGLSARGRRQAGSLAAALASSRLAVVYTSPLRRAVDTARPVGAEHGLAPVPLVDLREIDFGTLEGLTYDEAATRYPDVYHAWMEEPTRVRFPGGESYPDVRARAVGVLAGILGRHQGRTAAVVAHGGVIRAVLAFCLEMPPEGAFRLDQCYGAVSIVEWLDGVPLVRLMNADPTWLRNRGSGVSRLYSST
jgi:broad specificity phosphatase PhoE